MSESIYNYYSITPKEKQQKHSGFAYTQQTTPPALFEKGCGFFATKLALRIGNVLLGDVIWRYSGG